VTLNAGATPSVDVASPGPVILSGPSVNGNPGTATIATTGLSVTGVDAYQKPGTYTGSITLTMAFANATASPATATLDYSYTITEKGTVSTSPSSIAAGSFTQSGAPQTPPWQFTAANSNIATSIAAVTSSAASLTMKAYVSSTNGPETAATLNLATSSQSTYTSFTFPSGATPTIPIGGSAPGNTFATGTTTTANQTTATQVLTTGIILTVPASAAPGTYTGTVTITLNFDTTTDTTTFTYSYTIPTYLNVSVDQGLFFHIGTPGTATAPSSTTGFANPYITISAAGNAKLVLGASLTSLTFSSNTIPTSQIWLAIDTSATSASTDAGNAVTSSPSGLASITYPATGSLALGIYSLYLSGRIKTTTSNAPGVYGGTLTITISVGS
jgi:hypothetical protein